MWRQTNEPVVWRVDTPMHLDSDEVLLRLAPKYVWWMTPDGACNPMTRRSENRYAV